MADERPIPVILDTDIGGDIDDTWALAMMLRSPELDVRLIVTDTGDTTYRARIVAKLLEIAGRTDIPIGLGLPQASDGPRERQAAWVAGYDLRRYSGPVLADGVGALIETIRCSPRPVTLVCIGPVPNIGAALRREPRIAENCRFVGMLGCFRRSHGGAPRVIAEYNVVQDVPASQAVFAAPWPMTITPLDTCGLVRLSGDRYRAVCDCPDPLVRAVVENYRVWLASRGNYSYASETESSFLYDTVAVHLAFNTQFLAMEQLGARVDERGFTLEAGGGRPVLAALDWTDLEGYENFLVDRLTNRGKS
ncbi:MAG TPA: nucleoside hydrolase [bacterium]|uniref:Pyrimidine-specific ribonucleoside hydrolase RihA n=1 Tax=candidate division TA06 bacterium ADurb.Bin417 TaxID=1852828 RepID=A0A1V5MI38_UNCT6|nr:MAG: Pyrimidine-specific ribonucleoside hydrolase RihA [candidate division TA06 bacterium ADurb.Bin417]HNQ35970.1 nucleoside hydrolase [bacterium]HNS47989.1 nucleoside hydrolase [bacterium]